MALSFEIPGDGASLILPSQKEAPMRRIMFAIASLGSLCVCPHITKADLTCSIVDYPTDHYGYSISGTITTDGTLGTLTPANILAWTVILQDESITSSFPRAWADPEGLTASETQLTLQSPSPGSFSYLLLSTPYHSTDQGFVNWNRDLAFQGLNEEGKDFSDYYTLHLDATDPWVIAVAQSSVVPEPSSLAVAGLGIVCGVAYVLARKRMATTQTPARIA
jgi:hypothetical protein